MNLARGREYSAMERSIDVQISRLRRMVEEDPAHPRYIQTVWGLGYVLSRTALKHEGECASRREARLPANSCF